MRKRASLYAAAAIVLVSSGFALLHAWRNRARVEADITMTERELRLHYAAGEDDSGVGLSLVLSDDSWSAPWLDQNTLKALGFDISVRPADPQAPEFYLRQRSRRAFVACEYDGPAWRAYFEQLDDLQANRTRVGPVASSHLVPIAAGLNAARLRATYPDRGSVLIVPAVVGIRVQQWPKRPVVITGEVRDVPSVVHVPRPLSEFFAHLPQGRDQGKYTVRLRYGAALEPWVVAVAKRE